MLPYEFSYMMEELAGPGIATLLISGIPSSVLNLATYILSSLALYTLAKRRGLNRPWLAWIPLINCWIIGSLSDQYRYVVKGEIKSKRKVLLTLNILTTVLGAVAVGICIAMAVGIAGGFMNNIGPAPMMEKVLGPAVAVAGLSLPMVGMVIAAAVIRYMALYDIYRSMDPVNCVLYTVLSILFGITEPFFLFFNRNKDLGMPPRRQETVYQEPVYTAREDRYM